VPPTATPVSPTATPEPPTATPEPPTATPEPPTATPDPDAGLRGKTWKMTSYFDGSAMQTKLAGTTVTVLLSEDGSVSGSGGCNTFGGTYTVGGDGTLAIGPLGVGQATCAEPEGIMEQEAAYLAALGSAARYTLEGGQLYIQGGSGEVVIEYIE
jgi:heat shock protein HslJ